MRIASACRQCRTAKRKCTLSDQGPGNACVPCQHRDQRCSNSLPAPRPRVLESSAAALDAGSPRSSKNDELDSDIIQSFVALYLRFIHDRPHSLFHEKSLWRDIRSRSISQCLLDAICALGCRFSTDITHRDHSTSLRQKSSSTFAQHLEIISLAQVQTCILLANLFAAEQDHGLEALYFGIANRMAYVLRLHEPNPQDSPVLRETKCRVWWTLFMADRWCPPGLALPREIDCSHPKLDFPMDEIVFQQMKTTVQSYQMVRCDGLWKHMITLADIFGPIQDVNISLVRNEYDKSTVDLKVAHLAAQLSSWQDNLPEHMIMNEHNLERWRSDGHGGTLVALHFGYFHYSTLLFFQYLDAISEPSDQAVLYANRCRSHALAFSRLLFYARKKADCPVVYLTVAYMTMVSSAVLLHQLLFGEDAEVNVARTQLTRNFEALVELRQYWPHMDKLTQRLLTFQNACLRSTTVRTHAMDRWMVRFLLEHALPLGEKDANDGELPTVDAFTPNHEVPPERRDMLSEAFADLTAPKAM